MTEQPFISTRSILLLDLVLLVGMVVGSTMVVSPAVGASVAVGGLVATASFLALQRDVRRIFRVEQVRRAKAVFLFKYYARLALLAAVLYGVIKYRLVDVVGLIAGLSSVVLSILVVALLAARTNRCTA